MYFFDCFSRNHAGVGMWVIRPYVILHHEVPKRMEVLEHHLEETYPDRSWEMEKAESTFSSHYLFYVTFEDEPDYSYSYHISNDVIHGREELQSTGGRNNK
ncbi:hypothetical protein ACE1TI_03065 [Alteribacillus sp. JSM 102045]|uniref:hypothetical protein n=1 Tax=Alteribacillus sp. JSM 102045 TaxID=1562101 RepID=UPI0035BF7CC4